MEGEGHVMDSCRQTEAGRFRKEQEEAMYQVLLVDDVSL